MNPRHLCWLLAVAPAGALAQDVYFQPRIELRAEGHTNRDLRPDQPDDEGEMAGYVADASLQIGRRTPTGELTILPRIRYSDFPERDNVEKLEEFFDIRGVHNSERATLGILARYASRDAYKAEFPTAVFDPIDPEGQPVDGTGRLAVAVERTQYEIRPNFAYRLSERRAITGGLQYQQVDYSPNLSAGQVDYRYGLADLGWRWQYDERSYLDIGPYVSRYEAKDDTYESDSYGVRVTFDREVSERTRTSITFRAEHITEDTTLPGLPVQSDDDTGFELMLNLTRKVEAGDWRLRLGRAIVPTGAGSVADSDEIHVEHNRALTARVGTQFALRALRIRARSDRAEGDDRDFATARAALSYALTPTWSVLGGYEAVWREYVSDTGSALDHALFVSARFTGLGPQR